MRCRLMVRCQMHGEIRDPGYVFELPAGVRGPHRTVVASSVGAQIVDHFAQSSDLVDEPLYQIEVGGKWINPADIPGDR